MLDILLLNLIPIALLYVIVNADSKSSKAFKKKRFNTALAGMCFLNFVLVIAFIIIAEYIFDLDADFKVPIFSAVFLITLILALWATKHIRAK